MQLQKEVKSNLKQPSCKKNCVAPKRPLLKKMWNPRWRPRNGCDGRLMAKFLITTIQVNLVPNPSETRRRQHNSPELLLLKILPLAYHHSHFLAATLDFTSFSTMAFLGLHTFFYCWAVLDYTSKWRVDPRDEIIELHWLFSGWYIYSKNHTENIWPTVWVCAPWFSWSQVLYKAKYCHSSLLQHS